MAARSDSSAAPPLISVSLVGGGSPRDVEGLPRSLRQRRGLSILRACPPSQLNKREEGRLNAFQPITTRPVPFARRSRCAGRRADRGVRSPKEWQAGHIPRAKHIPLDQLTNRMGELDSAQPVAFICQSGARSKMATKTARQAGLDAMNINGGMLAWQRDGLPASTR